MEVIRTIAELRTKLRHQTNIGLVPSMGYLHQGHLSLIKTAKSQCDIVVLSIFVNPLQFGPNEDYATYPRDTERDISMAEEMKVDIVFIPEVQEIYPNPMKTKVTISELTDKLCGLSRPGFFDGVATVVIKLFHIVKPNKAFFGLKDIQQLTVIQQMVTDLNLDVEIVPCDTLRESDGLAMSSRNVRLNQGERKEAVILSRLLRDAEDLLNAETSESADLTLGQLKDSIRQQILDTPLAELDYAEILTYPQLTELDGELKCKALTNQALVIALAVKFGTTRLIDNVIIRPTNKEVKS